ncbi:lipocalin-like domain-containing protein [Streptomyces puniciscabiei]
MDDLVGAWALSSVTVGDPYAGGSTGSLTPLGVRPHGMLLYGADGWMSALLASGDDAGPAARTAHPTVVPVLSGAAVAYAGRWERSGDQVRHHVRASHYAPWIGRTLTRSAALDGDRLVLLAETSKGQRLRLQWYRADSSSLSNVLDGDSDAHSESARPAGPGF